MDGAILIATGPLPVPVPGDVAAVIPVNPAVLAQLAASRAAAGIEQPTEALYLRRPDVQVPAVAMRVS